MTKVHKFIYIMIVFLSIFHVVNSYVVMCEKDSDCVDSFCVPPNVPKCRVVCKCLPK
ncbi:putative Late nodulin [Medicago truncatula]|nr:putative Late nodulin [Medicago truncatula]